MRMPYSAAILLIAFIITGCATNDPDRRAKTGAAVGAAIGAVLGHQLDDDKGRFVGAAVGAITGAAVGKYMDQQEKDFQQALEEEQRQNALEIERLKDDTLRLTLNSEVSFDFDKSDIKPTFFNTLDKLSNVLIKYDRTVVHIIGHTDSVGAKDYNMKLSQRRANSVSSYVIKRGIPADRVRTEGRGESEPRDTNETESGRQLNRRVDVYVKPIIEGQEQKAFESPQYL